MYRGFNLKLQSSPEFEDFYKDGLEHYSSNKQKVKNVLESFCSEDGCLDASKLQDSWFPRIQADIFISHSHNDEKLAIGLAGWLKENLQLTAFIDSCAWGNSYDLLKEIDNEHCLKPDGKNYCYEKRNQSTSHVHMMLATSLMMMIDNSECVFFLNTPASISTDKVVGDATGSPWIYSEIAMTQMLRRKTPNDHRGILKKSIAHLDERLQINYSLDLKHLTPLQGKDLASWKTKKSSYKHSLDSLYAMFEN